MEDRRYRMKKLFFVFTLIFSVISLYGAPRPIQPVQAQPVQKQQPAAQPQAAQPKTVVTESYSFAEELIEIPLKPFEAQKITDADLMKIDPQLLKLYENAVNAEQQANALKDPASVIKAWTEVTKITQQNPFLYSAIARLNEWKNCVDLFNKHQASLDKIKMLLASTFLSDEQKTNIVMQHLEEFGVTFGTTEIVKATVYNNEIAYSEALTTKIKEVRKQRCDLNAALDCQTYGLKHAANDEEKAAYLKKACDLGRKAACSGEKAAAAEAVPVANAQPQAQEQPKEPEKPKELTEEEKFKKELNDAGRRTRIIAGTTTLVAGVVIGALGGVSLYGMSKAKKDRDEYLDSYNHSSTQEDMDNYRQKTNDADSSRKTYMILGGVGIGVGVALIATGITFYSIEFEGEKEVKKKYNVSFGTSPMDGTLQFALRW